MEEKSDERSFDRGSESSFPRAERSVGSECEVAAHDQNVLKSGSPTLMIIIPWPVDMK